MLKKIVTAVFASALTLALAAPAALACPGSEHETAKEKEQPGVIAQEDEAGKSTPAEAPKAEKKQQPKAAKAQKVAKKQKKPVRVSQK
jgi:hypothetical protein